MKTKNIPFLAALATWLLVVLLFFGLDYLEKQRYLESLRGDAISHLSHLRAKLEARINTNFFLTRGLIAYVATHPDIDQETFYKISRNLLRHQTSIINIGLAPDNVVSFVYPMKGNERALGLNYQLNEKQWPAVKTAIESRKTVVAGPVNLVQGGTAFISRTPIFVDHEIDPTGRYWGLASIVIDKALLFSEAGFYDAGLDVRVAIRGKDGLGAAGEPIDGDPQVFAATPVVLDVLLPEGSWQLAAVPLEGWAVSSPYLVWIRSGGFFLALLSAFAVYAWLIGLLRAQDRIEQASRESRRQQRFLNAVIENIPHVIFVKNANELRYLRFNKAGEELTGLSEIDLLGKNDYDLFDKEQAEFFIGKDREVLANRMMLDIGEETISTLYRGERLMHTKKIPILAADGTPEYLLGIAEDITEQRRTEEERLLLARQLQQAQKMEAIGLMAGGVAHDLNNILAAITGYPELMLRTLPSDSPLKKPLQTVLESGQRAVAIVADLLTVAKGAASERKAVNLNQLIKEYLESPEYLKTKAHFAHGSVYTDLAADLPPIWASPVHIKKCLMNLVNNAVEAMDGEGHITLSTSSEQVGGQLPGPHPLRPGNYVVVRVQDDGPGIAKADIERIFEPFYTKKVMGKGGTGLGLAVVWNTVKEHDGQIFVDSDSEGTQFTLYLPVCIESACLTVEETITEADNGRGESILIVDDEAHMRDIGCQMLQLKGYRVAAVANGEEAVEFIRKTPVDLVVIDMLLGRGMNGRQTYAEIIKLYPQQRALIASGYSESEDVKAALTYGIAGFIHKPYTIQQLSTAVSELLGGTG